MELSGYLRVLRAHWVVIIAAVLASLAAAAGFTLTRSPVYTADASAYVSVTEASGLGSSMVGDQLAKSRVKSYLTIGSWRTVAESAIAELELSDSPEALVSRVSVSNPANSVVLCVTANGSTPEAARDLADAWVRGLIAEVEKIEGSSDPETIVRLVAGEPARLPTSPSSPNVRQNLALGGLLGVALGVGYALVRDLLDRRIRSADGVEQATGLAVVGALPLEPSLEKSPRLLPIAKGAQAGDLSALAEAFRGLRTNLQYTSIDDPPRAVAVTSPLPGDGKTFVAANLAITLAATGQRTVLIDADLRRPMLASLFGLAEDVGLSDVLAGRAEVDDVLRPVHESDSLFVLAAGSIPPNPSEILGTEKMHRLIATLSTEALVVIDSPPLLPVTDSAVLSTRVDGMLVVVSTGRTTYEVLEKSLDLLGKAHGKALGVVLNRVPRTGPGAVYYGYQYTAAKPGAPVGPSREPVPAAGGAG